MTRELSILKNYIFYFIAFIFVCFIGSSNVFGLTYTNIGEIRNVTQQLVSTAYGNAPFTNPVNSGYAFGQVLQVDYLINNYQFNANTNYQLESNLPDQVFTNANYYSVQGLNGESCLISYNNSILNNDHYPRWAFQCPHATSYITISIKNSSNEYLWSGTGIFNWTTALLKSSDTSLSSGSSDSDAIINNNNQNTQIIINNNNQNTQDIIDNQNANTQSQIDSQKVCSIIDKTNISQDNKYIAASDGYIGSSNNYGITDYIEIFGNSVDVLQVWDSSSAYLCFYDTNKTLISCSTLSSLSLGTLTIPNNSYYLRSSIRKDSNKPNFKVCKNGNQALSDDINNLNDSLNDDDTDGATSEASDFFDSFTTDTFGLTSIITAPLTLIQSLTSSTCTQLHLPLPYLDNKYLDLPCMTSVYQTYFGSFFTIYQTITYGIIAYWVCVRIFNQVKDFKNPEHDEIEVVDL